MRHTMIATLALACATSAMASGSGEMSHQGSHVLADGMMTYEIFETAIAHVDLVDCPKAFDPDDSFCRMTLANDMAHVFVFDYDGAQPLVAVKSYALDDGFLPF